MIRIQHLHRVAFFLSLVLTFSLSASEQSSRYPLWNGSESVAEYAKRVNLSPVDKLEFKDGVSLELALVPAGKFMMGSQPGPSQFFGESISVLSGGMLLLVIFLAVKKRKENFFARAVVVLIFFSALGAWGGSRWHQARKFKVASDQLPLHEVTLTHPFYMGKFTVTQNQYQQIAGSNPSIFTAKNNPVEMMSWISATDFCKLASKLTKRVVRLPSEAEWEYACRAGSNTNYYSGDNEDALDQAGWYHRNGQETSHPVGQKAPNKFNLYDMHGNVIQWCSDWYSDSYYQSSPGEDPCGPANGEFRVLRGGSWLRDPMDCRSSFRAFLPPHRFSYGTGFRVVVEIENSVDK